TQPGLGQMLVSGPVNRWGTLVTGAGNAGNVAARGDWASAAPYLGGSDGSMLTPPLDTRGFPGLPLHFAYPYHIGPTDALNVDVWAGATWRNLFLRNSSNSFTSYYFYAVLDLEPYRNAAMQVRFRWTTDAADNNYYGAEIDDIFLFCINPDEGNGAYGYKSGTSMATPHATGVAALILSRFPNLCLAEWRQRLLATGDPVDSLRGITVYGTRANAFRAVATGPGLTVTSPNGGESWRAGTSHPLLWVSSACTGTVNAFLYKGGVLQSQLVSAAPNTGALTWAIPANLTP